MGCKESDVTEQLSTKSLLNAFVFYLISKRVNLQFNGYTQRLQHVTDCNSSVNFNQDFFFVVVVFNEKISFCVLGKGRRVN